MVLLILYAYTFLDSLSFPLYEWGGITKCRSLPKIPGAVPSNRQFSPIPPECSRKICVRISIPFCSVFFLKQQSYLNNFFTRFVRGENIPCPRDLSQTTAWRQSSRQPRTLRAIINPPSRTAFSREIPEHSGSKIKIVDKKSFFEFEIIQI